jgi:hypothetical protein
MWNSTLCVRAWWPGRGMALWEDSLRQEIPPGRRCLREPRASPGHKADRVSAFCRPPTFHTICAHMGYINSKCYS